MKKLLSLLLASVLVVAGSVLALTAPSRASADTVVTGYQTGYSYHEGLANGDGALLMADNGQAESVNAPVEQATTPVTSDGTSVSVTPQAAPSISQAAVVPSTYIAPANAEAASPTFLATFTPAMWGGIGLIALAVLLAIVAIAAQPRRDVTVTRSYHRYNA